MGKIKLYWRLKRWLVRKRIALNLAMNNYKRCIIIKDSNYQLACLRSVIDESLKRILFIINKTSQDNLEIAKLLELFTSQRIHYQIYYLEHPIITPQAIDEVMQVIREDNSQGVIGIGNDAVMNISKFVATLITNPDLVINRKVSYLPIIHHLPFLMLVPLRLITGNQIIMSCHYRYQDRDWWLVDAKLIPKYIVLSPQLMISQGRDRVIDQMIGLLVNAIDVYLNRYCYRESQGHLKKAIRVILNILPNLDDPNNRNKNHLGLLESSTLVGKAINRLGVGYTYIIVDQLLYLEVIEEPSLGIVSCLILIEILKLRRNRILKKLSQIGDFFGFSGNDNDKAVQIIGYLEDLVKSYCRSQKVKSDYHIASIIEAIKQKYTLLGYLKIILTEQEITKIITSSLDFVRG